MSYTYDDLCRVCNRRIADLNTGVITNESFSFDAASNLLTNNDSQSVYDANNRLVQHNEFYFDYDADGNITVVHTENDPISFYIFDSRNRLISDGTHTYTYNAENTRIRSICNGVTTYYTYNTNAKLSQLLHKQTQGVVTKYVYGLGLIGEEKQGTFKTYHFDYRGSTVAITDMVGNITDTFAYDTYGKLISRTGETDTPFLYNGRDGVMTEDNGLYYMRARYYSPELRRFINADIVAGEISNSPTLNRYAYANGNPVSNVDPMGLSADDKNSSSIDPLYGFDWSNLVDPKVLNDQIKDIVFNEYTRSSFYTTLMDYIDNAKRPENVDWDSWNQSIKRSKTWVEDFVGVNSKIGEYIKYNDQISIGVDALLGVIENYKNGEEWYIIGSDLAVDVGFGVFGMLFSNAAAGFATGLVAGSVVPGAGNAVGALAGFVGGMIGGLIFYVATDVITVNGKTAIDVTKDYAGQAATNIFG